MKKAFTVFVIIFFSGIAVFGVNAIDHALNSHSKCLAAILAGETCRSLSPLAFVDFHFNVLKGFLSATLDSTGAATAIFSALAFFLGLALVLFLRQLIAGAAAVFNRLKFKRLAFSNYESDLKSQLSFYEHSPTLA